MSPATPALDALRVTRTIPASPDRVYRAWTTPEEVRQWWGRTEGFTVTDVEMDVRVGGRWRVEMRGFDTSSIAVGTFQELSPPGRIAFTFGWVEPRIEATDIGETYVTVEFRDAEGGGTEVVLVHERLSGPVVMTFHEYGWKSSLAGLGDLLGEGRG